MAPEHAAPQAGDFDAQIAEFLMPLSGDLAVWRESSRRFRAEVFCGAFLGAGNEGISLRPETLLMLGARGLSLDFDIYAAD